MTCRLTRTKDIPFVLEDSSEFINVNGAFVTVGAAIAEQRKTKVQEQCKICYHESEEVHRCVVVVVEMLLKRRLVGFLV